MRRCQIQPLSLTSNIHKIKTHIRDRLPRPRGKLLWLEQPVHSSSGYPSTVAEVAPAAVTEAAPAAVAAGAQDIANRNALDLSPGALRNSMLDNTNKRAEPYVGK
jgi:hypothetical protein